MNIGDKVFSSQTNTIYTVIQPFKAGGQAEVAFAKSDKSEKFFFIKKLLSIRYTEKGGQASECKEFEENKRQIYRKINQLTLPGGSCVYIYDFFREKTFYYVVTEKIFGVEFRTKDIARFMTIEDKISLFSIIAYSFYPLERNGIIHGDVKPGNILLKKVNNHFVAKLIDLESSFLTSNLPSRGLIVGTEPYYSPELAIYNNDNSNIKSSLLSTKSDIFSLGIILYEILTGEYPTIKNSDDYTYEIILRGEKLSYPKEWSNELIKLMEFMFNIDPQQRPDVIALLSKLKGLPDISLPVKEIFCPYIVFEQHNLNSAYVALYTIQKNTKMYYSIDGSEMFPYIEPFAIYEDDIDLIIMVELYDSGTKISKRFKNVISVTQKRHSKVTKPIICITSGLMQITCKTSDATIYYTIDGSSPDKYSKQYKSPCYVDKDVLIKAIARKTGMLQSDISSLSSNSKIKIS